MMISILARLGEEASRSVGNLAGRHAFCRLLASTYPLTRGSVSRQTSSTRTGVRRGRGLVVVVGSARRGRARERSCARSTNRRLGDARVWRTAS